MNMKQLINTLFLILSTACLGQDFQAQTIGLSFQKLSTANGLPGDIINAIFQDSRGFIWIGTNEGLVRYGGNNMKIYRTTQDFDLGLPHNRVTYIEEDANGYLAIRTNKGLVRFNPKKDRLERNILKTDTLLILRENLELKLWVEDSVTSINGVERDLYKLSYRNTLIDSIAKKFGANKTILKLENQTVWISSESGLFIFEPKTQQILDFPYEESNVKKDDLKDAELLGEDRLNGIWLVKKRGGLLRFDPGKGLFDTIIQDFNIMEYCNPNGGNRAAFGRKFLFDYLGKVVFYSKGLYLYDPLTDQLDHYTTDPTVINSLASEEVTTLLKDNKNRLWVGTNGAGISIYDPHLPNFQHYSYNPGNPLSLSNNFVSGTLEEENGVWVFTGDGVVNFLDFQTNSFRRYPLELEKLNVSLQGPQYEGQFTKDQDGNIYVYSWKYPPIVFIFDKNSNAFKRYKPDLPFEISEFIRPIPYVDSKGHHYYYSFFGRAFLRNIRKQDPDQSPFIYINPETGEVKKYYADRENSDSLSWHQINSIIESSCDDYLWISTRYGLNQFDKDNKRFIRYLPDFSDPHSLGHIGSFLHHEDKYGNLWLSYENGNGAGMIPCNAINSDSLFFLNFNTSNTKLPSNFIIGVEEDQLNNLWIITQLGPCLYNYDKQTFHYYDLPSSDKIPINNLGSSKGKSGQFYLGTPKGLFSFNPNDIQSNMAPPRVYFTDFEIKHQSKSLKGQSLDRDFWENPSKESVMFTKEITLPYRENNFSIYFTAVEFTKIDEIQYQYLLENFDKDWLHAFASNPSATYTNLPPGNYKFKVKAANFSGKWNEKYSAIQIKIIPPWYWNGWSRIIYLSVLLGGVYLLFKSQLNRRLAKSENLRLKELDTIKTQLYTNLTHEFRTPLTVIAGMTDQIEAEPQKWFKEGLKMIKRNTQNLLSIVNQMLNLRKLESGSMKINMIQTDVIPYLKYLFESFQSYAESKDIRVHFICNMDDCLMDYDPEKMQRIVSNLMSNAIKFTKRGGNVYMMVQDQGKIVFGESKMGTSFLTLKVRDTGVGISEDKLPYVFDRFYQVDDSTTREGEGTGIGLTLTKALVNLLGGEISLTSQMGKGSEFTVRLPITQQATLLDHKMEADFLISNGSLLMVGENTLQSVATDGEFPLVLIVEDNADVVQYLISCLDKNYKIEVARNGQEGIEKALELTPDIVISDVMMPKKDGFDLTENVKTDIRTSHIPIILLTAKADASSKIEGLSRGADVYLPKPFDKKELLIRMQKLIDLRKQLQQYYQSLASGTSSDNKTTKTLKQEEIMENKFVRQARQVVEANMTNYDFSVKNLCEALQMSHSNLHRKLKALTGYSSNEFILHIRLEKARWLLCNTEEPISNIAYDSGFGDPGYFSRAFRKKMGLSPSEYREKKQVAQK